jgi:hypothetical protein
VDGGSRALARLAVENNDAQGVNKATGRVCVLNILHTQGALDAHAAKLSPLLARRRAALLFATQPQCMAEHQHHSVSSAAAAETSAKLIVGMRELSLKFHTYSERSHKSGAAELISDRVTGNNFERAAAGVNQGPKQLSAH